MDEFKALLELLLMMATDPLTVVLFALLIIAAVTDYRTYRIPNWLTFGGTAFALIYATVASVHHTSALLVALGGLGIGLAMMLPAYLLRVMGAGDVKLMAMVGAFLGVHNTLTAVLYTFIVGGIAALGFALYKKQLGRMVSNITTLTHGAAVSAVSGAMPTLQVAPNQSVGKLPYGVCISIGTMIYVVARQLGFA